MLGSRKFTIVAVAALIAAALTSATIELPRARVSTQPGDKIKHERFNGRPRYLTWLVDSIIKRGVAPTTDYTTSAFYSGVLLAYQRTGNKKYLHYVTHQVDVVLWPDWNGTILLYNNSNSVDDIRIGHSLLDVYDATGNEVYKTPHVHFANKSIGRIALQRVVFIIAILLMWIRCGWMGFGCLMSFTHAGLSLLRSIIRQLGTILLINSTLIDAGTRVDWNRTNGLPLHGFDYSKKASWADPVTGASPHIWSRAVGWYFMALVDTLGFFPLAHAARGRLGFLRSLADAVVVSQDTRTKGWWLIMTPGYEGSEGNYIESSGSSMFVYGMLKSLRLGYIKGKKYEKAALAGYELMTETFASEQEDGGLVFDWTVQTGSLSSNATFEYYTSIPLFENDLKGVAPFLYASYESEIRI